MRLSLIPPYITRDDTHMTSTLRGVGVRQKRGIIGRSKVGGRGGGGVASVFNIQYLFFLLKKIGFAQWRDII